MNASLLLVKQGIQGGVKVTVTLEINTENCPIGTYWYFLHCLQVENIKC